MIRDGRATFVPVKIGIAGEKYFEVLERPQGRRRGHHRAVRLGAQHAGRRRGARPVDRAGGDQPTNGQAECTSSSRRRRIALQAIWANKLRSLLDGARQHRRRDLDHRGRVARPGTERVRQGRDSVASSRPTRSAVQRRGSRARTRKSSARQSNPRITIDDAEALRAVQPAHRAGHGRGAAGGAGQVPQRAARQRPDPRRDQGIRHAADDDRRTRPADHAERVRRRAPVAILG